MFLIFSDSTRTEYDEGSEHVVADLLQILIFVLWLVWCIVVLLWKLLLVIRGLPWKRWTQQIMFALRGGPKT